MNVLSTDLLVRLSMYHIMLPCVAQKTKERDLVLQSTPQRNGVRAAIARICN